VYKKFYRNIEAVLREIDSSTRPDRMLRDILGKIVESFAEEYGIESGRLYRESGGDFELIASVGEYGDSITGKRVPADYPIIKELIRERMVMITPETPGFDPAIEYQFSHLDYAAIYLGGSPAYILSFGVQRRDEEGHIHFILQTIRTSVGLKLRQSALEGQLRQAQQIQQSLLPLYMPELPGYELAAVSLPAEEVGGDVYDAQEVEEDVIGITIADASGHGLPAALQARDAMTGLRMGIANDRKINVTIENLNNVIHQSGLSSRFVSLFYGELEKSGNLIFVNCGHCPPLLFSSDADRVFELHSTGPVLGPLPDARYRRSFALIRPGDALVLFSDGLIERKPPALPGADTDAEPVDFGRDRLIATVKEHLESGAGEIVEQVMETVRSYGGGLPWEDDVTLFVIKRHEEVLDEETTVSDDEPVNPGLRLPGAPE